MELIHTNEIVCRPLANASPQSRIYAQADGDFRVRIFTPVNELPFAGHPTLGTAVVLGGQCHASGLKLETAMGTIPFTLVRDRAGERPLFYARNRNEIIFATEIAALVGHGRLRVNLDQEALRKYLQFGIFPSPDTPFGSPFPFQYSN